jgi:hypothetical protein
LAVGSTKFIILPEEFISNSPVILAAPVTSSGTVGAAWLIPMRPVVVNAVLVLEAAVTRASPVISSAVVGVAWLIPMRPVVVSAVLVVAPEFTRAAPPATSNLTPGVVVPIPTFPLPFITIRSVPTVLIRTEFVNLNASPLVIFPIKSIHAFAGVCALIRKNPLFSLVFTPRISFAVLFDATRDGTSEAGPTAEDRNLIRGLSV